MRQNRIKTRKNNNTRYLVIIALLVALPLLAVSIGYFGTKHFLVPRYFSKEDNDVNKKIADKNVSDQPQENGRDKTVDYNNKETEQTSKKESTERKSYSFEVPALSIYNIQVGSFDSKEHAQNQIKELNDKGFGGYIVESDRYRVMVMSFTDRSSADQYKNDIKDFYSDTFISQKQLSVREINYDDKGKEYSEVALKEIGELKKYYENFSNFLANNDISNMESSKIAEFVDREISRLDKVINKISSIGPTEDFKNFNNKFMSVVKTSKTKLSQAKESNFEDKTKIFEIFMESLNSYEGII